MRHVRTRVRSPGQNGSRERGFGLLKCEKLFLEEMADVLDLVRHAEDYRTEYNTVRPHEALAWNRHYDVHTGAADPLVPHFPEPENLPVYLTRDIGTLIAQRDGLEASLLPTGRRADSGLLGALRVHLDSRVTQKYLATRLRGALEFLRRHNPDR
ncbi:integrase core domain-containing protein [Streptomyces cadmiisoli]|uniref:integrase core domain-containing protein n=1 Tax=Streptomyces cadmiisoli TaxID=2184053 RepID=UPI0036696B3B